MRLFLCVVISIIMLNLNFINAHTKDNQTSTDILPKVGATPSTYTPITGNLDSTMYNKKISIRVGSFTNKMESVNIGLYVDGEFQGSSEYISAGNTVDFEFPSTGKLYEIRMSTYSSTSGICKYSISIV